MIREYEHKDWPEVVELYGKSLRELYFNMELGYPDELVQDTFSPLGPEHVAVGVVSIRDGGGIQGFIVGQRISSRVVKLTDIYFEPRIRGTSEPLDGYRHFERLARERGYRYIITGTAAMHERMNKLFDKLGFQDIERIVYKELK